MTTRPIVSPRAALLVAVAAAFGMLALVLWFATQQPWLGLRWSWDEERQGARVDASEGPALALPAGVVITQLDDGRHAFTLEGEDFVAEPAAAFRTFASYGRFLARQGELSALLRAPEVRLTTREGESYRVRPRAARPLTSLTTEYWVQVIVGLFAWLISAGVWAFRQRDASARYLLLSGFSTLLFAPLAAVYSTRELALPAGQFLWICDLNFFGGNLYCATMIALLWYYPRRLGALALGPLVVGAFLVWYAVQELGGMDDMLLARRLPVFLALPLTFVLSGVQWRATRGDPVARAALSWFLMSWLVGTSLFAALTMVPQLFGLDMGFMQGYAFALFLLVYGGLAFGILRFRLFQLGEWWFRVFTWVLGAAMLFALDLLLVAGLSLPQTLSLGVALLVSGFLWLPLRGALWARLVGARAPAQDDLFRRVVHVAFAPSKEERSLRFTGLVERLFDPLRVELLDEAVDAVALEADGLSLVAPPVFGQPAVRLSFAGRGRRLFSPRDEAQLSQVVAMLRYVDESREAYNQGVREERRRIARDLHDDIGSRLLSGLHQTGVEDTREVISQALTEMRTIIHGLSGQELTLENVLAELRHETSLRLDGAGIALDWPVDESSHDVLLGYAVYKNFLSIVRELTANVIRHAHARRVTVHVACDGARLAFALSDDGVGFDGETCGEGLGISHLRRRVAELDGSLSFTRLAQGTRVTLRFALAHDELPLEAP